jgi:hypothetical protein
MVAQVNPMSSHQWAAGTATQPLRNATVSERLISQVTVTDPRHALHGQTLAVLSLHSPHGSHQLVVALPDGRRRSIPRTATDLSTGTGLPSSVGSASTRISVRTLLPLARHLRAVLRWRQEVSDAHPPSAPAALAVPAPGSPTATGPALGHAASSSACDDTPTAGEVSC